MLIFAPAVRKYAWPSVVLDSETGGLRVSRRGIGCILALVGGLLAGCLLFVGLLSLSYAEAWATYWERWGEFASSPSPEILTFPIGAALAAFLGALGLTRWRALRAGILVVAIASLIGAVVAVAGSVLFDCTYYGYSNMGCSGMGVPTLVVGTPTVWVALLAVTTVLALLARLIAGPLSPEVRS